MRYNINSFEDFNEGNLGFFGYRGVGFFFIYVFKEQIFDSTFQTNLKKI